LAGVVSGAVRPRFVLDAGAILALTHGDRTARAALKRAMRVGYVVVVPTPVVAQVHRGGRTRAATDRVLNAAEMHLPTSLDTARRAGELLGRTGLTDAIDAIVAAEALSGAPAAIVTSDPGDLTTLVEAGNGLARVAIVAI
jgi:predicted nucleic acid-binding protein